MIEIVLKNESTLIAEAIDVDRKARLLVMNTSSNGIESAKIIPLENILYWEMSEQSIQ